MDKEATEVIENLRSVLFKESDCLDGTCIKIDGHDFNNGVDFSQILKSLVSTGFQATNLGRAMETVNQMLEWRLSNEKITQDCNGAIRCKIFLGFSSNHASSGLRDYIRYVVEHRMVDVVVTTSGGIEADITKCLAPAYIGDFDLPGADLRSQGLNRIGNLLVHDDNYRKLQDWVIPVLDKMLEEQNAQHVIWTPSKIIARLGKEVNNKSSFIYWANKNHIPVYCPDLAIGIFGNILYSYALRNPSFHVEMFNDVKAMNNEAVHAYPMKTGMIILGGGLPKYHICNANMLHGGANYAVYINPFEEFDGSDSGASPEADVSCGKLHTDASFVKVHCDATIAFPLLVAATFASTVGKLLTESNLGEDIKEDGAYAKVCGYNLNLGVNFSQILKSLITTGFQATNLGEAIETVNQMLEWRLSHEQIKEGCSEEEKNPAYRTSIRCKIFLAFTSNLISSGVRDIIRYLVQHRMVDVIVTTTGGIEEDIMKCLAPTYKGDFSLLGATLRSKGLNRIGNLLVPNNNYCKFENWCIPALHKMEKEQKGQHVLWTPSKVIARFGKEINNESSYLYWAYKNDIPVFCPGITDGSLGDILFVQSYRIPDFVIDVVKDVAAMNNEAMNANPRKTGMIILGGGLPKHHTCNANLMRGAADYAVFINTAQEFDGCDSGARPDEAVSWGKISESAKSVKVHCDATIAFPLLVAGSFAATGAKTDEPKQSF